MILRSSDYHSNQKAYDFLQNFEFCNKKKVRYLKGEYTFSTQPTVWFRFLYFLVCFHTFLSHDIYIIGQTKKTRMYSAVFCPSGNIYMRLILKGRRKYSFDVNAILSRIGVNISLTNASNLSIWETVTHNPVFTV